MVLKDALLPEYDHEMGTTRRLLERVPDTDLGWKPHEKSMTFGRLAMHLAELPQWASVVVDRISFDLEAPRTSPAEATSCGELLAAFDTNVAHARSQIAARTDAELLANWTLRRGAYELFTLPRIAVMRSLVMNHSIHHRGQLSVYLRLRDIPLPAMYGPTADEGGF